MYTINDTGTIYSALRKFGTLEFVRCMGENVVSGVRSNEVRLYPKSGSRRVTNGVIKGSWDKIRAWEQPKPSSGRSWGPKTAHKILPSRWCTGTPSSYRTIKLSLIKSALAILIALFTKFLAALLLPSLHVYQSFFAFFLILSLS